MGYISFIDILGTKNAAKNAEKYMRYIGDFSCAISQALQIHTGIFAYIYSDCAYLESSLLDTLINALDQIRKELMAKNIYIRGSICKGTLGAIDKDTDITSISKDENCTIRQILALILPHKNNDRFNGTIFTSKDIAKAYSYESMTKGVAIRVDPTLVNRDIKNLGYIHKNTIREECVNSQSNNIASIVKSGFITEINGRIDYTSIYDISYSYDDEESKHVLQKTIQDYLKCLISDIKISRYYISFFISYINSQIFNPDIEESFLYTQLLSLKNHQNLYGSGFDFVYFALINKIYNDLVPIYRDFAAHLVTKLIEGNNSIINYCRNIDSLPDELISQYSKELLCEDIVNSLESIYGEKI